MLFSEFYEIKLRGDEEWFDPILHRDTLLFIDPFSVFKSENDLFKDSYFEIMYFFEQVFELIAHSGSIKTHTSFKKAVNMLMFPEVNAICLGYSNMQRGSGTGPRWAKTLADNISNIISKGITNLSHFEELGIFCEGIGPDRISDMTANLLKSRLVNYTQRICNKYNITMEKKTVQHACFDFKFKRWEHRECLLPVNPFKQNAPILLIPKSFLNVLPEINSNDFSETLQLSERLRNDLNYEVDQNLDKEKISKIALNNYDLVKEYIETVEKRKVITFEALRKETLRYDWYKLSQSVVNNYPYSFRNIYDNDQFFISVIELTNNFKNYIELQSGYKLLWNDTRSKPRTEADVQLLFKGIVDEHCKANNIDLTREVNQGMGPIDFRFSCGYHNRVLLEIKLARNTKFWNGLKKQLPHYMNVDSCKYGIFLVVVFTDKDNERISNIEDVCNEVANYHGVNIDIVVIDARGENKESASKLH